jgi:GNAT superfamily N-acetyltransferase
LALSFPEPLTAEHDVSQFSCGKPALDHWLKTRALSNQQKGFIAVLVVHDAGRVVGYYGLAPTAVAPSTLPRSIRTGQPPDPVPCLLLGQLATDLDWAGKRIGTGLVKHALERCVMAVELVGGRALMVNAVDEEAAGFWRRRGFLPSKDDPLVLYRSIADIAASLSEADRPE